MNKPKEEYNTAKNNDDSKDNDSEDHNNKDDINNTNSNALATARRIVILVTIALTLKSACRLTTWQSASHARNRNPTGQILTRYICFV